MYLKIGFCTLKLQNISLMVVFKIFLYKKTYLNLHIIINLFNHKTFNIKIFKNIVKISITKINGPYIYFHFSTKIYLALFPTHLIWEISPTPAFDLKRFSAQ